MRSATILLALLLAAMPGHADNWDNGSSWESSKAVAGDIDSESATDGHVLTADGSGNSAWEAAAGGGDSGHTVWWNQTQADTTSDHPLAGKPAPLAADSNNAGFVVALFDDTTAEGRVWYEYVPTGKTGVILTTTGHATTAPGAGIQVRYHLACRDVTGSDAWSAWQDLDLIDVPESEAFVKDTHTAVTLANLSCTAGGLVQFALSRDPTDGNDDLSGDFELAPVFLEWDG